MVAKRTPNTPPTCPLPTSLTLRMSITVKDIPQLIIADKNVTPFITRSVELAQVNPVVSYYCKVYVLEHILSQKLHQNDSEVEQFVVSLLDDTEAIKSSHPEESVKQVLQSRQLSVNLIFVFAFKLFHSCLKDLDKYDGTTKPALVLKLRASLNVWALFSIFTSDPEEALDFAKTTGGKCSNHEQFVAFTKDKTRTLKYQLSRLLKDEIPMKGEDAELERFNDVEDSSPIFQSQAADEASPVSHEDRSEIRQTEFENAHDEAGGSEAGADATGANGGGEGAGGAGADGPIIDAGINLPGAPKFDPGLQENLDLDLPGAPKYMPDEEDLAVNKNASIQVIPPSEVITPARQSIQRASSSKSVQITKADVGAIVDATEQISKAQKHAKFAISALNYEDLSTAEAELLKGIEILRRLKAHQT